MMIKAPMFVFHYEIKIQPEFAWISLILAEFFSEMWFSWHLCPIYCNFVNLQMSLQK